MAKTNIKKLLENGTIKAKIDALIDDRIKQASHSKGDLTPEEKELLLEDVYNSRGGEDKYIKAEKVSSTALTALNQIQGLMFNVKNNYSILRAYFLAWNILENAELMGNLLLSGYKTDKEKENSVKELKDKVNFPMTRLEPYQDKWLRLDYEYTDNSSEEFPSLKALADNANSNYSSSVATYKGWDLAFREYVKDNKIVFKTLKEVLDSYQERIVEDVRGWDKYEGNYYKGDTDNPVFNELMKEYNIKGRFEDIEPSKEAYLFYKNFLSAKF